MQRSLPARAARAPPRRARPRPSRNPAPAPTAAAAAAAAPRRSWLGPIAGLAAGIGLAALMSHLGFGAEFGNLVMLLLLGVVAVVGDSLRDAPLRRRAGATGLQLAGGVPARLERRRQRARRTRAAPRASPHAAASAPQRAAAARLAGRFRRRRLRAHRQADLHPPAGRQRRRRSRRPARVHHAGDVRGDQARPAGAPRRAAAHRRRPRRCAGARRRERRPRGRSSACASRPDPRSRRTAPAEPFDEVWHLVRPADGSRDWAIAGIQHGAAAGPPDARRARRAPRAAAPQ